MSTTTMQAAVLHAPGDLRLEEIERPRPAPDEALVAIRMNGICGSDVHFYREGRLGPFVVDRPYVPGHEACGVVAEVGSACAGLREGDRVAVEPGIPCRRCRWCKTGRYNLCPDVRFLSAPPENGTFADYVAVPGDFLHPLPDDLSDEEGAFLEPFSVAVQACNRGGLRAGARFVVLGAGPIGLITALAARAYGGVPAGIVDVNERRLEFARSIGLARTVAAGPTPAGGAAGATDPVTAAVLDATGGEGADLVFDCTGSSKAASSAPGLAARGGVVVLVGWPEIAAPTFPLETVLEKELDVRGVNRYCNTFPTAIALLAERRIDLSPLVSHRFPFERVLDAFALAEGSPEETVKVMVAQR